MIWVAISTSVTATGPSTAPTITRSIVRWITPSGRRTATVRPYVSRLRISGPLQPPRSGTCRRSTTRPTSVQAAEAARLATATPSRPPPASATEQVAAATAVRRTASTARDRSTRWSPSRHASEPSVTRSTRIWTANSTSATRSPPRRPAGVWKKRGSRAGPMDANSRADRTPIPVNTAMALATTRATPGRSSSDARSATARVVAVPTPRSARENQPVTAENVCTSTQVPNAAGPRPCRSRGRVTSPTTIAHTLAKPVDSVLSRTRRRKREGPASLTMPTGRRDRRRSGSRRSADADTWRRAPARAQ